MKIGIIGGGAAGLTTAWLLEEAHEVFLFEKDAQLGGHVQTVQVPIEGHVIPVEAGFEFFNKELFPYFTRLLQILKIPTHTFPANYTFYSKTTNLCFPPMKNGSFFWNILRPHNLNMAGQFYYFLYKSSTFLKRQDKQTTLHEFIQTLYISESFISGFLYPFLSSQWGFDVQCFKQSIAYDILSWLVLSKHDGLSPTYLQEISSGVSTYISILQNECRRALIHKNTAISQLLYEANQYTLVTVDNHSYTVDHLIIATNGQDAASLLSNISHADKIKQALYKITYQSATIAVHADTSFMPPDKKDWSVANIYSDGIEGYLTTYKSWKSEKPIFRSWLFPHRKAFTMPNHIYGIRNFEHPLVDAHYMHAQEIMQASQGHNNLWFAGMHTLSIDAHESAIASAITLARKLSPQAQRLHLLEKANAII